MSFSIFLLSALVAFQSSSICDAAFEGESSPQSAQCQNLGDDVITCRAMVTYDDGAKGRQTVTGHVLGAKSCDPNNVCTTFTSRYKNVRCTDGFCCRGSELCSGQPRSVAGGVGYIMLILSTLAISFAMYI